MIRFTNLEDTHITVGCNRDTDVAGLLNNLYNKIGKKMTPEQLKRKDLIQSNLHSNEMLLIGFMKETRPYSVIDIATPLPNPLSGQVEV